MQMHEHPKHVANNTWPCAYNQAENCTCCQQELQPLQQQQTTRTTATTVATKIQAAFAIRFRTAFIASADCEPYFAS